MRRSKWLNGFLIALLFLSSAPLNFAQSGAKLSGTVTIGNNTPVHNVTVTILQLKRSVETDEDGRYVFNDLPPGTYDVVAHLHRFPDVVKNVQVGAGATATADFQLTLTVKEEVTVTATGSDETSFNSIQSVASLGALEIAQKNPVSLGEALDNQLGVAKRSFGPGNARPVIRGFDGDRVLVLQDGERIGSLGSQSGDHGEPIDVLSVEKLEVVKGPATLLYGSSAIGGVVNAVTGHEEAHQGVHGYLTGIAGTNRSQFGGSGGIEFGTLHWLFWANGGGQRSDDYESPRGVVANSFTRSTHGSGGFGYYKDRGFFSLNYDYNKSRYGIPFDSREEDPEIVGLNPRKQSARLNFGLRDLPSLVTSAKFTLQYNDYKHSEFDIPTGDINTTFKNKTFVYDGLFDQKKIGRYSGTFGFWGLHRDFDTIGAEALAPPTTQNAFAGFALQKFDFERFSVQLGGRVEHNGYDPDGLSARSFTGFSGAAGVRVPTWTGGALVVNYSHSYRAPSLEELYNNGPHPGNGVFEIGDENLKRERGDGIELGVRHSTGRVKGEFNFFYYNFKDFVFLAPTGDVDEEEALPIAEYRQANSRFVGAEAQLSVALHNNIWLNSGLDYVNAELTDSNTPLPRIPPLRGRVGFDFNYKGLTVSPEAVMAKDQNRIFPLETRTGGYTVFNLKGTYTLTSQHIAHVFSLSGFNLGNRFYLNHLSFIKDIAPEIGRGVRLTYTMRFF
ncbi:MAG: TonB-dependent receptor [Acidobacteriota bacterium]